MIIKNTLILEFFITAAFIATCATINCIDPRPAAPKQVAAALPVIAVKPAVISRTVELANLGQVYELQTEAEFEQLIKMGNMLVEFTNPDYCNPCRQIKPQLEKIASQFKSKVLIIVVHTGTFKNLAWKYDVRSIPALYFFKNGVLAHEASGYRDAGSVANLINKHLLN